MSISSIWDRGEDLIALTSRDPIVMNPARSSNILRVTFNYGADGQIICCGGIASPSRCSYPLSALRAVPLTKNAVNISRPSALAGECNYLEHHRVYDSRHPHVGDAPTSMTDSLFNRKTPELCVYARCGVLFCVCFPNSFSSVFHFPLSPEQHWQIVWKICIINEATHCELLQLLRAGSVHGFGEVLSKASQWRLKWHWIVCI